MDTIGNVFKSSCFWSSLSAWMIAQFAKMLCDFLKTRRFDFRYFVSTGGMPSAHSAMVSGLATAIGMITGFQSPVFVISLAFALIVMFDASTVRRAAGQQAKLLNELIEEFIKEHRFTEQKLVELLGHTRLEVFMGMIIGILTAIISVSIGGRFF